MGDNINDKLNLVLQYKNDIKQSILDKGQEPTDDMSTYSELIKHIVDYTGTVNPEEYSQCLSITESILSDKS